MKRTTLFRHGSMVFVAVALVFGMAHYASAFIAFPYNFSNGTPADASQVNQNFQAINAKQTPTRANMAGTYLTQGTDFYNVMQAVGGGWVEIGCTDLSRGTMTLTANGAVHLISTTDDSCHQPNSTNITGTFSVNPDGTGTMMLGGGSISFRVSRDLNVIMWEHGSKEQGIAMRL